ncbi:MAG TPA: energy-coupling factor transporter transmembrane component T [Candidatus Dormibacteraeota bacterium]|nr:energy-coupling factor transporter transmembrane component T [Candidatus Dormibacteraeota bacterium]
MHARAVLAWSGACLVIVLATTNPVYRTLVLATAATTVVAGAGVARARRLLIAAGIAALSAVALNLVSAHVGADVLFALPDSIPALGGPYTAEALVEGLAAGVTLAAALLAVAPISLLLEPFEVVEALPEVLAGTGSAIAAALNLIPGVAASFAAVAEAQRLRGWRPRGPRSWTAVVVPVVLSAIEDSIQLAEAMEARAFGSGPRTHLRRAAPGPEDRLVMGVAAAAVAAFLGARATGWVADWDPYPFLSPPALAPLPVAACLALALPSWVWRSRASIV